MIKKIGLLACTLLVSWQACLGFFTINFNGKELENRYVHYRKVVSDTYKDIDDARISEDEKARIEKLGRSSSVYGEIQFEALVVLFLYLMSTQQSVTPADRFIDLGCGVGKVATTAYLLLPVSEAYGIEYGKERYDIAMKALPTIQKLYTPCLNLENGIRSTLGEDKLPKVKKSIGFAHNNFLLEDLSRFTIGYTCSTLFDEKLLADLMDKIAKECKDGFRFISLKKLPEHKDFHLVKTFYLPMTWTPNDHVYYYVMDHNKKHAAEPDFKPFATMQENDDMALARRKFEVPATEDEEQDNE